MHMIRVTLKVTDNPTRASRIRDIFADEAWGELDHIPNIFVEGLLQIVVHEDVLHSVLAQKRAQEDPCSLYIELMWLDLLEVFRLVRASGVIADVSVSSRLMREVRWEEASIDSAQVSNHEALRVRVRAMNFIDRLFDRVDHLRGPIATATLWILVSPCLVELVRFELDRVLEEPSRSPVVSDAGVIS